MSPNKLYQDTKLIKQVMVDKANLLFLILTLEAVAHTLSFVIPSPADIMTVTDIIHNSQAIQSLGIEKHVNDHVIATMNAKNSIPIDFIQNGLHKAVGEMKGTYSAVKQAIVSRTPEDAVASVFSESAAGAIGSIISRTSPNSTLIKKTLESEVIHKTKRVGSYFGKKDAVLHGMNFDLNLMVRSST